MHRLSLVACALVAAGTLTFAAETGTKYGEGVKLATATAISEVAAKPAQFMGKTVRVDGVVTAVCENMGCWMQLKDETSDATLRIKVEDGVIVFPLSAKGKKASAEGVIEKVDVAGEAAHHEAMVAKDPKMAKEAHAETPAAFQLKATGAVVY